MLYFHLKHLGCWWVLRREAGDFPRSFRLQALRIVGSRPVDLVCFVSSSSGPHYPIIKQAGEMAKWVGKALKHMMTWGHIPSTNRKQLLSSRFSDFDSENKVENGIHLMSTASTHAYTGTHHTCAHPHTEGEQLIKYNFVNLPAVSHTGG